MIAVLLVALGIPLWLVAGAVGAGLWSRRSFRQTPGAFPLKVRRVEDPDATPEWPRRLSYGLWAHDVLIVHQGIALIRHRTLPVAGASHLPIGEGAVKGLGDSPVGLRLRLDSGEVIAVAAPATDRDTLIEPLDLCE